MNSNSLTIGRFLGIQLRIHYSWIIIFALVAWSVTTGYIPIYNGMTLGLRIVIGLLVTLLFFVSVVCHEYAHSLVARSRGVAVKRITLFLFGGAAELTREPANAKTELLMTIAGPATSLLISCLCGLIWAVAYSAKLPLLVSIAEPLCLLNLTVGIFNLLPAYPLDGGRILRSILWLWSKDILRATQIASYSSYGLSYLMMGLAILALLSGDYLNGLWLGFLGYFLRRITKVSFAQTVSGQLLGDTTVEQLMNQDFITVPPTTSVDVFLNTYVLGHRQSSFLVGTKSDVIGVIELTRMSGSQKAQADSSILSLMVPISPGMRLEVGDHIQHALQVMQSYGIRILPVFSGSKLTGVVTSSYIDEFVSVRAAELRNSESSSRV